MNGDEACGKLNYKCLLVYAETLPMVSRIIWGVVTS